MVRIQYILAALAALAFEVRAQQREFRLFYRFGFDEGRVTDPEGTPTREDVDKLMCVTANFLTDELKKYTENDNALVITEHVDWGKDTWVYNGPEPEAPKNVPIVVNFTAVASTTDGSRLSSAFPDTNEGTLNLLWESTKHFDYFSYIMDYIWKMEPMGNSDNFFTETRGMWYEPFRVSPVTDAMMTTPPSCPQEDGPIRGAPVSFGGVPTMAPISRGDRPDFSPSTLAPTAKADEMVYFSIQIDFFRGKGREPREQEINDMMCEVNKFFAEELRKSPFFTNKEGIETYAVEIDYNYERNTDLPSVILFFSNSTYLVNGEREHIPAEYVFNTFEVSDVAQFVEKYIWMAPPQSPPGQRNIYYETEDIYFGGSYTGSPIPPEPVPGKLKMATCPAT